MESALANEYKSIHDWWVRTLVWTIRKWSQVPQIHVITCQFTSGWRLKVRVVFCWSAVLRSGLSLNDILLLKRAKSQTDIIDIPLQICSHNISLTADAEKIYGQVRIVADDCDFHHISYLADLHNQLTEYKLNTVSPGTTFLCLDL